MHKSWPTSTSEADSSLDSSTGGCSTCAILHLLAEPIWRQLLTAGQQQRFPFSFSFPFSFISFPSFFPPPSPSFPFPFSFPQNSDSTVGSC